MASTTESPLDHDPKEVLASFNEIKEPLTAPETSVGESNAISWDSSSDQENPMNWSYRKKLGTVVIVSAIGFSTPFSSSVASPAASVIMSHFHYDSQLLAAAITSIYVLGTAIGPFVFAPSSEIWGRSIVFQTSNILFIAMTLACALSTSLPMLLVFRFLAGCAGSAAVTVGGGTIGDTIPMQERGKYIAVFALGGLLGPYLGPLCGGFITESKNGGWRWTFWLVVIIHGIITTLTFILLQESYAPVLLHRKMERLRKQTGNSELYVEGVKIESRRRIFSRAFMRPLKILFMSPITWSLAGYQAVVWGYTYLMFTTIPQVFMGQYNFDIGIAGLVYIAFGTGALIGLIINGQFSDRIIEAHARKLNARPQPEARLVLSACGGPIMVIGLFWYGWSAQAKTQWIVPIIGLGILGLGTLMTMLPCNIYMIDAFTEYAASALAASFFLRSVVGGFLPLAGGPMFSALGDGWGISVLAFISLAMCLIPLMLIRYGEKLRTRYPVKL